VAGQPACIDLTGLKVTLSLSSIAGFQTATCRAFARRTGLARCCGTIPRGGAAWAQPSAEAFQCPIVADCRSLHGWRGQAPQRRHRALCVAITMYRYRKTVPEKSGRSACDQRRNRYYNEAL